MLPSTEPSKHVKLCSGVCTYAVTLKTQKLTPHVLKTGVVK